MVMLNLLIKLIGKNDSPKSKNNFGNKLKVIKGVKIKKRINKNINFILSIPNDKKMLANAFLELVNKIR